MAKSRSIAASASKADKTDKADKVDVRARVHWGIATETISGTTGGALLAGTFGLWAAIFGGIVAGLITGYSGYHSYKELIKRLQENE